MGKALILPRHTSLWLLTHFQVLVEQRQSTGILQVVVLLPGHVLVRFILGHGLVLALSPPVVHFPERPRDKLGKKNRIVMVVLVEISELGVYSRE